MIKVSTVNVLTKLSSFPSTLAFVWTLAGVEPISCMNKIHYHLAFIESYHM